MTSTYTFDKSIPRLIYNPLSTQNDTYTATASKKYQVNTFIDWSLETLLIPKHSQAHISRKWITLILSAIVLGYTTAFIQLMSINLNDAKMGICFTKSNMWSLLNPYSTCPDNDWYNWSRILFKVSGEGSILINLPIYIVIALLWSILATFISSRQDRTIKQSGIPEIKMFISGFTLDSEYLGLSTLIYKTLGLILVVSSGLWLGKEGPLVHVSCCIFNIVYNLLQRNSQTNEAVRREFLMAAVAAGIAVAFDSPIGGVLFVFESMNSYFMPMKILWNSFVSATIAVVILTGFKLITDGKNFAEQDLFQVNFGNFSWLFMELGPFLILGILGGLYGYSFTKLNSYFANFRHVVRRRVCSMLRVSLEYGTYVEISIIVVITGLLNFPIPLARLSLNTYLKLIFQDCTDAADEQFICNTSTSGTIIKLGYIALQGFFLSAYSYGLDLPGGILMPTLVIGATTGRALGIIAQVIQSYFSWDSLATCTAKSCLVSPSSYAVIGAASFMTGITKLTMCVVVVMFEMTGAVTYVLPIMFGVMTSKFTNDWLCTKNIYDTELLLFNRNENGSVNSGKGTGLVTFSTLTTTEKAKLPDVTVQHIMIPLHRMKCLCIHPEVPYTVASIYNFTKDTHEVYPVIISYEDPTYLGYVSKQELLDSLDNLPSTPIQIVVSQVENYDMSTPKLELFPQRQIIIANPKTQLNLIIHEFEKLYINYMCILQDGKLAGFIDRFILTKLIESDIVVEPEYFSDIDNDIELSDLRLNRKSIELIT